jgi:hypothetical protein
MTSSVNGLIFLSVYICKQKRKEEGKRKDIKNSIMQMRLL